MGTCAEPRTSGGTAAVRKETKGPIQHSATRTTKKKEKHQRAAASLAQTEQLLEQKARNSEAETMAVGKWEAVAAERMAGTARKHPPAGTSRRARRPPARVRVCACV
eukprot:440468-Rhodomonas_salina.1